MKLTCIIIDDEPNAVKLLDVLLSQNTEWQCLAKCYNALEAIAFFKQNKVDLVFLDINMPLMNGIELATLLPADTRIVFTTAYSEHALESFNFQTIDYLLKPITLKRFISAVNKIETYFQHLYTDEWSSEKTHFFFKSGKILKKILLDDILYFEGEQEYIRVVAHTDQLLIYRRLKEVEEQLSLPFIRVHNSYIVNTAHIDKIQDNHIHIRNKQVPVSEKYRQHFMEIISRRIF